MSELAEKEKLIGNQFYTEKKFNEAIESYTRAIELSPTAIYYCNRAAAHFHLKQYGDVVEDCTESIRLNPYHSKAFKWRSNACKIMGDKQQALLGTSELNQFDSFVRFDHVFQAERPNGGKDGPGNRGFGKRNFI